MTRLAIIGGTGLARMDGLAIIRREMVKTPYGAPSCPIVFGELSGQPVAFLARHGSTHKIPPHRVNYCANIWALNSVGVEQIIAVGAVGGIAENCTVGSLVVPKQIIDYTNGRPNTFFDGGDDPIKHIDFSFPYNERLRSALLKGGQSLPDIHLIDGGCYGATQGPRFETAAEIVRMKNDGCTVAGMTGMPEAALAAELDIHYACCGVVVNRAAGLNDQAIDIAAMPSAISTGMNNAKNLLNATINYMAES